MRVICKAMLLEVYESKKTASNYYTFADMDDGGQFVISVDGRLNGVKNGTICNMDIHVKGRLFNGRQTLVYEGQGQFIEEGGVKQ